MSTIGDLRQSAIAILQDHSATARLDVDLLLAHALGLSAVQLITESDRTLSKAQFDAALALVKRRQDSEPVAYITGHKSFMDLDFLVDRNVLIPRPDTEILVEKVLADIAERPLIGADIGTGSGAIAIALLRYAPQLTMWASDISAAALAVAKKNALKSDVAERLNLLQSDILSAYGDIKFDFIVSNPPYIDRAQLTTLDSCVRDYEPLQALAGGEDGLDYYRRITAQSLAYLKSRGRLYFEIGYDQRLAATDILQKNGFSNINCLSDLAGRDRVIYGIKE